MENTIFILLRTQIVTILTELQWLPKGKTAHCFSYNQNSESLLLDKYPKTGNGRERNKDGEREWNEHEKVKTNQSAKRKMFESTSKWLCDVFLLLLLLRCYF